MEHLEILLKEKLGIEENIIIDRPRRTKCTVVCRKREIIINIILVLIGQDFARKNTFQI